MAWTVCESAMISRFEPFPGTYAMHRAYTSIYVAAYLHFRSYLMYVHIYKIHADRVGSTDQMVAITIEGTTYNSPEDLNTTPGPTTSECIYAEPDLPLAIADTTSSP